MSNEMNVYGIADFNKEMFYFSRELNKLLFDYFYIDSAEWDIDTQEMKIVVKMLTMDESDKRNKAGDIQVMNFQSANQMEYFTAQVMKDRVKLKQLSIKFVEEHEEEVYTAIVHKLTAIYNDFKTIEHPAGSKMSLDIEIKDVDMFYSESKRII